MIEKHEIQAITRSLGRAIKEYVSTALVAVVARLDAVDARLNSIPRGLQGDPGKDVDPELVRMAISGEVERQLKLTAQEPPAIDMVAVTSIIQREVRAAVDELPPGPPGKDADPEFIRSLVITEVAKIPPALPGNPGEPGKSIDPAEVRSMVAAEVASAVAAVPPAQPGKDADPVDIREVVSLVLKEIPPPQPGKDADMEAVFVRISEEITQRIAELPKPKNGDDGKPPDPAVVASMVRECVDAALAGFKPPKDGEPGRDATQIEILPAIDVMKSYPRGTHAIHDGGLMRSFRTTDPLTGDAAQCGWEVMVNGLAGFSVSQSEDLRTFHVEMRLTGGKTIVRSFAVPVVLDRGVFKDGESYQRGDSVTWSGSAWICQEDTTKDKPGLSKAWRLSVKRGADGKDLRTPEDKPKPGPVTLK